MLDSMTFNGIRKPWLYLLEGRRKPVFAPRRNELKEMRRGARLRHTRVDPLPISQPIGFKVDSNIHALELKDELAEWLVTDGPAPLQFDDEPGRTYYALVENSIEDLERLAHLRWGSIQFICPDPYGYGQQIDLHVTPDMEEFIITGQVETPWTATVTFTDDTDQYELITDSNGRILLNYSFIAGDVLTIDYNRRKIYINGTERSVAISVHSRWFLLRPGTVGISATHDTALSYIERFY